MPIAREDVLSWIRAYAASIDKNKEYLTQLDSDIGDGDHGANMARGFQAVESKLPEIADKDIGVILKTVGMTLVSTVGGASGPLYGTFFLQLGTTAAGKMELYLPDWISAMQAGVDGVVMRGKVHSGDKTMIDTLLPALQALKDAALRKDSFADALKRSAEEAENGMLATIPMMAQKGRASYMGERSIGHQDPGATSANLLLKVAAEEWADVTG